MKNNLSKLDFSTYKIFIVDWDGTLIDSQEEYKQLDKLFVQNFYKVQNTSELQKLEYKCISDDWRDKYYRKIDSIYADGNTPLDKIYRSVNKHKKIVQSRMRYLASASVAINKLRRCTDIKLVIATNSNRDDIDFFSSNEWVASKSLNPQDAFDGIVTIDDIKSPKPNAEMYRKIMDYYNVDPREVLVFDDNPDCLETAKKLGADTLLFSGDGDMVAEHIDFAIDDWNTFIQHLVNSDVYDKAQQIRIDRPMIHDHYVWENEWQDADYYEISGNTIPGIQWTGIYCFGNIDGKIPIVNYENYPSGLPGGHIDQSDRSLDEALRREIKEEINCKVLDWKPIGYKIILKPNMDVDYQLFVYANLEKDGEFSEDRGGLVHDYSLHDISEFSSKIKWNKTSEWLEQNLAKYYE